MKKTVLTLVAAFVCASGLSAQGQQAPPAKPEQKPPAAAAEKKTIAGNWTIVLDAGQGPMEIAAAMKLDGKKLTGTLSSQMGDTALAGEFEAPKVSFSIDFNGTGITFTGTMKTDDLVEGTMSGPMGEIPWKGTRAKG
jgi:hypothetical protein